MKKKKTEKKKKDLWQRERSAYYYVVAYIDVQDRFVGACVCSSRYIIYILDECSTTRLPAGPPWNVRSLNLVKVTTGLQLMILNSGRWSKLKPQLLLDRFMCFSLSFFSPRHATIIVQSRYFPRLFLATLYLLLLLMQATYFYLSFSLCVFSWLSLTLCFNIICPVSHRYFHLHASSEPYSCICLLLLPLPLLVRLADCLLSTYPSAGVSHISAINTHINIIIMARRNYNLRLLSRRCCPGKW